jgi:hypothetical protein
VFPGLLPCAAKGARFKGMVAAGGFGHTALRMKEKKLTNYQNQI